jgi:hypothetical protein
MFISIDIWVSPKMIFKWYEFTIGLATGIFKSRNSKLVSISKPLLKAKGRIHSEGDFI